MDIYPDYAPLCHFPPSLNWASPLSEEGEIEILILQYKHQCKNLQKAGIRNLEMWEQISEKEPFEKKWQYLLDDRGRVEAILMYGQSGKIEGERLFQYQGEGFAIQRYDFIGYRLGHFADEPSGSTHSYSLYNEWGKLTEYRSHYHSTREAFEVVERRYDDAGRLLEEKSTWQSEEMDTPVLTGFTQILRDEQGNRLVELNYNGKGRSSANPRFNEKVWNYNEHGQKAARFSGSLKPGPENPPYTLYDPSGQLIWDGNTQLFEKKEGKWQAKNEGTSNCTEYEYNQQGQLINERYYSHSGELSSTTELQYNEAGRLIEEVVLPDWGSNRTRIFQYDAQGRKLGWTLQLEGYQPSLFRITPSDLIPGGYILYETDEKIAHFNEDLQILSYKEIEDGKETELDQFTYDENGNLVKVYKTLQKDFWRQSQFHYGTEPLTYAPAYTLPKKMSAKEARQKENAAKVEAEKAQQAIKTLPIKDQYLINMGEEALYKLVKNYPIPLPLIHEFQFDLDWEALSENQHLPWDLELIRKYDVYWHWPSLAENPSIPLTPEIKALFVQCELQDALKNRENARPPYQPFDLTRTDIEELLREKLSSYLPFRRLFWKDDNYFGWKMHAELKNPPERLIDIENGEWIAEGPLRFEIKRTGDFGFFKGCPFGDAMRLSFWFERFGVQHALLCSPRLKEVLESFQISPHKWVPCEFEAENRPTEKGWLLYLLTKGRGDQIRDYAATTYSVTLSSYGDLDNKEILHTYEKGAILSNQAWEAEKVKWQEKNPGKFVSINTDKEILKGDYDILPYYYRDTLVSIFVLTALAAAGIGPNQALDRIYFIHDKMEFPDQDRSTLLARSMKAYEKVSDRYQDRPIETRPDPVLVRQREHRVKLDRHAELTQWRDHVLSLKDGLKILRNRPDKPDFVERCKAAEMKLGPTFPMPYVSFIFWLQAQNRNAKTIGEMPEARVPAFDYGLGGAHFLNLEHEIHQETATLQKETGNDKLVAFARLVNQNGTETGLLGFHQRTGKLCAWIEEDGSFEDPEWLTWERVIGNVPVLEQFTVFENDRNVVLPAWYKFAQARGTLLDRIGTYDLRTPDQLGTLMAEQYYIDDLPQTVNAICLAEEDDSYHDDFLCFLLKEGADFELDEIVYQVTDSGDYIYKPYTAEDLMKQV